jgi:hypothetical protein
MRIRSELISLNLPVAETFLPAGLFGGQVSISLIAILLMEG